MAKLVLLVALLASAGRWSLASEGNAEEQLFPPLHPNCTQSLTDLLLLRQETQMNRMATAQEATTELLVQVRDSLLILSSKAEERKPGSVVCVSPFTQVGGSCLLLALNELHTWASARQFCAGHEADLAHFSDANTYAAILGYINTISSKHRPAKVQAQIAHFCGRQIGITHLMYNVLTKLLLSARNGSDGFDKGDI
ncbi:uncharacterized protein [Penaeus vannamei]